MSISAISQENPSPPALKSVSVLKFGPGEVLFVGDSRRATLFAFELGAAQAPESAPFYNVHAIDAAIAERLGVPTDEIRVKGLAVHPVSQDAYIAVHRGHGESMLPVIVRVNARREITALDLATIPHTQITLQNPIDPQTELRNHIMARNFTITDVAFHGGEVLLSGLSNAEFASSLYRIPYPFRQSVVTSSIEMFHAVHNQNETRAPIQAMTVVPLDGKPHVLAAYTCTPLVTIAVDALQDGAHIHAKTIGELGYGNTPISVLPFQSRDRKGQAQEQVLITNKNRGPLLFTLQSIAESNAKDGLSTGVGFSVVAPTFMAVPMAGLLQVADQNAQSLLGLRRDIDSGRLGLLSFEKGMYFRVTDFVSEYQMPSFTYSEKEQGFKQWQEGKLVQEGVG